MEHLPWTGLIQDHVVAGTALTMRVRSILRKVSVVGMSHGCESFSFSLQRIINHWSVYCACDRCEFPSGHSVITAVYSQTQTSLVGQTGLFKYAMLDLSVNCIGNSDRFETSSRQSTYQRNPIESQQSIEIETVDKSESQGTSHWTSFFSISHGHRKEISSMSIWCRIPMWSFVEVSFSRVRSTMLIGERH